MTAARRSRPPARPPAFVASCVFGVVGAVLLLVGFFTESTPVLVASGAAGALSLICALVWRSQLIDAWRAQRRDGGRQSDRNGAS